MTPDQFVAGMAESEALSRFYFAQDADKVRAVNVHPILDIRATLKRKYAARGWPGKPVYKPPPGWVRVESMIESDGVALAREWIYSVMRSGELKNCAKGPEPVNGGNATCRVWRFDLAEAVALRKSWLAEREDRAGQGGNEKAPDYIERDGMTYVRAAFLAQGEKAISNCLGRLVHTEKIDGFVGHYKKQAIYAKEKAALAEIEKYKERRTMRIRNKAMKAEIVRLVNDVGPIHTEGIRQALGLERGDPRVCHFVGLLVKACRISRGEPGWYGRVGR